MEEETPVHEVLRGHEVHIDVEEQVTQETEFPHLMLKRKSQTAMDHARTKALR